MYTIHRVAFILVIFVNFINAKSCITPNNENGECVGLNDCESLLPLIRKTDKTIEEIRFVRQSQCDLEFSRPRMCCPLKNDCVTPEGTPGACVGLYDCQHIADVLINAKDQDSVAYIKDYVCNGPEEQSVCCSPPKQSQPGDGFEETHGLDTRFGAPQSNARKKCVLNALPPSRNTKCCGLNTNSENRIVGGTETGIDKYPWLVLIEYIRFGEINLSCGGALISGRYVLTAGHCVMGDVLANGEPTNIRLGEYNTTNDGKDCVRAPGGGLDCTDNLVIIPIEKIIPHPSFKPFHRHRKHDIALIRLISTVLYTDFIRPVCLPSRDYLSSPPNVFPLFIAGWGRYIEFDNGTGLASDVKLHARVYLETNKCESIISRLQDGQFCARGEVGENSCQGDSGGSLMFADETIHEAIGIISFGPLKCGKTNLPGIYTNVYKYLDWIKRNIRA